MPRERVADKVIDLEKKTVTFKFFDRSKPVGADGKRPYLPSPLVIEYLKYPTKIRENNEAMGVAQKIGDSYADSDDGTPYENALAMHQQLMDGVWAQRGGGGERLSLLIRALVEVTKQPEETVRTYLEGLTAEQRKSLPDDPQVAPVMARIKADDATKKAAEAAEKAKGQKPAEGNLLAGLLKAAGNKPAAAKK